MSELRLARIPDRTPIKRTISVAPDLHSVLHGYAEVYKDTYGDEQSVADLIPYMLTAFLASDRGFAKARGAARA